MVSKKAILTLLGKFSLAVLFIATIIGTSVIVHFIPDDILKDWHAVAAVGFFMVLFTACLCEQTIETYRFGREVVNTIRIEKRKRQLEDYGYLKKNLQVYSEKLQGHILDSQEILSEELHKIEALQERSKNLEAESDSARMKCIQLELCIQDATNSYNDKLSERNDLEKRLEAIKKHSAEDFGKFTRLRQELEENQSRIMKLQPELELAKQQLVHVREEREQLQKEYESQTEILTTIRKERDALADEVDSFNAKHKRLVEESNQSRQRIEHLKDEKEGIKQFIASVPYEVAKLQSEINEMSSLKEKNLTELQALKQQSSILQKALEGVKQELNKERKECDKNQSEIRALEHEQRDMTKKLQSEKVQLSSLQQDKEAKEKTLTKILSEKNKLGEENTHLANSIDESEEKIKWLQGRRDELKAKYSPYKNLIENMQKEFDEPKIKKQISQTIETLVRLEG